ncbi:hypothetical protein QR46_1813 [Giardia duodenalis assemblage B]|uniref:Uncharacterized protein n=1 Tax=Giardia duodenalis assemblage B TaxID=1394984 RepID=A0A132NVT6_GIAIN|nr:hypothetical protein QR46_1813 [Giardia intestinalis assemblage B]
MFIGCEKSKKMGSMCSTAGSDPHFNELTIRLVGSFEDSCPLSPELLEKYKSLISEGREIDDFFQSTDSGLKLYQIATREKTEQAMDACLKQIVTVSETIARYLVFQESFVPALVYLLDCINKNADSPFIANADDLWMNIAKMNNPEISSLLILLTQLFDICSSIDKKFLNKNFDSSVGIFRRLAHDKHLDINHSLSRLATSQTVSMSLSGPGPTLRQFIQSCMYMPTLEPRHVQCQRSCTCNCGVIQCACGCPECCSCHNYTPPPFLFEMTDVKASVDVMEGRIGFLLTLLNGILGTLDKNTSLRTGLDSVYYRRVLLCGTTCLNSLHTDYLQRFKHLDASSATGVFHASCKLSVLRVCTAITSGEDEGLFLRHNLADNARKPNDKPADSNAILSFAS